MRSDLLQRYRDALASRDLARYLAGYAASTLGDNISCIVLLYLAQQRRGDAADVALVLIAYSAPGVVTGPLAGSLLDRFDRRRLLVIDNALRAVAFLSIPLAQATGDVSLAHLVVVAAIHGALGTITLAGGPALIPDLVPKDALPAANALELLGYLLAQTAGRFVAGTMIAFVSGPYLILVDCASYVVFIACLMRIDVAPTRSVGAEQPAVPISSICANRVVRSTTVAFVIVNLGAGAIVLLATTFARECNPGDVRLFGILLTFLSLGQCAGAFASAAVPARGSLGRYIAIALVACGASIALLATARAEIAGYLLFFLVGGIMSPVNVWIQTIRMTVIPPEARGRAFAVIRTLIRSTIPVSAALAAFLLDRSGFVATTLAMAALVGAPGLYALATGAFELDSDAPRKIELQGDER